MSEGPQQPAVPPNPTPTTVVGYPSSAMPQPGAGYASPGVAGLRSQLRTLRYLVLGCLALLVVLTAGLVVSLVTSQGQMSDLSAQVAALEATVSAPPAATQPESQAQAPAQESAVTQLGEAPTLAAGTPLPAGADAGGAILIGNPDAANVVEVYVDYQCPFCQKWEATIGSALADRAMQPGSDLLIKQYNLAFLGETSASLSPAGASARAASAAACVVNHDGPEAFVAFSRSVFEAADPSEPPGQFTADVLTSLATQAGASPETVACIEAETNVPFVAATTQAGFGRGVGGTPTVIVNGQTLGNPFTDPSVLELGGAS